VLQKPNAHFKVDFAHKVADGLTLSADGIHGGIILFASEQRRHVVVPIGSISDKAAFVSRVDSKHDIISERCNEY
jgi:hypothetical protein